MKNPIIFLHEINKTDRGVQHIRFGTTEIAININKISIIQKDLYTSHTRVLVEGESYFVKESISEIHKKIKLISD